MILKKIINVVANFVRNAPNSMSEEKGGGDKMGGELWERRLGEKGKSREGKGKRESREKVGPLVLWTFIRPRDTWKDLKTTR